LTDLRPWGTSSSFLTPVRTLAAFDPHLICIPVHTAEQHRFVILSARDRKRATGVKVEGRRSHSELRPEVVAAAKLLHKQERLSYREISARLFEAGHINKHGDPFSASSIKSMLQS